VIVMNLESVRRINRISFVICLTSVLCGVVIGLLGVWGVIGTADGLLWRAVGSCGILFIGSICTSAAIGCFRTNEM
jgi:hypothetical protein